MNNNKSPTWTCLLIVRIFDCDLFEHRNFRRNWTGHLSKWTFLLNFQNISSLLSLSGTLKTKQRRDLSSLRIFFVMFVLLPWSAGWSVWRLIDFEDRIVLSVSSFSLVIFLWLPRKELRESPLDKRYYNYKMLLYF